MKTTVSIVAAALVTPGLLLAQASLPAAPAPRLLASVQAGSAPASARQASAGQATGMPSAQNPPAPSSGNPQGMGPAQNSNAPRLTIGDAERMAIRNNPRVTVGRLMALAQHQVVLESRSAELPTANGDITGVEAEEASRLSAGSLSASRLFEHAGAGLNFSQLIYDFGHTHNLVLSQKFREKSANANALATTEDIVLSTDQAFYDALTAQSVLDVAKQTVAARQATQNQINQMTRNKLKSTLDLSFANVDLSQAQLLQLDAQNNADEAMAALDAVLGLDHNAPFALVEEPAAPAPPPHAIEPLIQAALQQRPDLQALGYDTQAAQKYARAEWDQLLPTISASGTAGVVPVRPDQYYTTSWWGAIGGNIHVPIFNGFLYLSQAREAHYRAQAASENARDLRDRIVRDVHTAWLQANNNWQRMAVTAQLVQQSNMAFKLAQTRYQMGLSSIVELSQAQLQQTTALIQDTGARYQYRLALATLNYEMGVAP